VPVYEQGYRHWEPSGRRPAPPWWAIARRGIVTPLRSRRFLGLLVLAWAPALVKGVILYFSYKAGRIADVLGGTWTSVAPPGYFAFLSNWMQKVLVLIVLALIGSGLIARDRRENGLALYFARPVRLREYVLGKGLIVLFYFCAITLAPALVLAVYGYLAMAGAPGLDLLLLTPLRLIVFCAVMGGSLSLVMLALSSLGRRTVFVAVSWLLLFTGSEVTGRLLGLFGGPWMRVIDFPGQYYNAGSVLFGAKPPLGYSPAVSWLLIAAWTALACLLLARRIRPVEVVA
jgi:hypothetical protein